MVTAQIQERAEPRKQRSPVERPEWRVHARLVPDPCRHVDHVAGVLTRLSPERLSRRHLRVATKPGGLQEGRHSKLERHGHSTLNRTVVFGELTAVYSRRIPRSLGNATNSGVVNSVPLSERMHSTMDGVPLALMPA